jgi:hypothetical protein
MSGEAECGGKADRDGRYQRKAPGKPDWRTYANPQERLDLEALEENALQCEQRRRKFSNEIATIRTRCLARRKWALAQKARKAAAEAQS